MLQIRPNCECCDRDLPPESEGAFICSFECTFCSSCVEAKLGGICPNCGGELVRRPRRPANKLAHNPPSASRIFKPQGCAGSASRYSIILAVLALGISGCMGAQTSVPRPVSLPSPQATPSLRMPASGSGTVIVTRILGFQLLRLGRVCTRLRSAVRAVAWRRVRIVRIPLLSETTTIRSRAPTISASASTAGDINATCVVSLYLVDEIRSHFSK